jgi:hypothetical protein
MRDCSELARLLWLRRIIGSVSMREYDNLEEKVGQYRNISAERQEIYKFGRPEPTRHTLERL